MAWKLPYKWWKSPDAFPVRYLYLDLLWRPDEEEEEGRRYRFSFLVDEGTNGRAGATDEGECWFRVSDIVSMESGPAMVRWLNTELPQDRVDTAYETLDRLYRVVHTERLVAFYEERSQDIEKVLQVFIRANSGGTVLSYADMLLSVAVAQWTRYDARREIHAHVDVLNDIGRGFEFRKDLVLKAGLMLSDVTNVGFKVRNFNHDNMSRMEDQWIGIKRALTLTVQLLSDFGFNGQTLGASSAILPIAYYLYKRAPGDAYLTHSQFAEDRQAIREWMNRGLLKASGIWGSGLDTLLMALRDVIKSDHGAGFPIQKIQRTMAQRGRNLSFESEEMEQLVDMQFGDRRTFALLSLVFPFVDLRNEFHVDHIFPAAHFTRPRLKKARVPEDRIDDFIERRHGLANLQLLDSPSNREKADKLPVVWLAEKYSSDEARRAEADRRLLGDVPASIVEFDHFFDARKARLKARIEELLGTVQLTGH